MQGLILEPALAAGKLQLYYITWGRGTEYNISLFPVSYSIAGSLVMLDPGQQFELALCKDRCIDEGENVEEAVNAFLHCLLDRNDHNGCMGLADMAETPLCTLLNNKDDDKDNNLKEDEELYLYDHILLDEGNSNDIFNAYIIFDEHETMLSLGHL
ncbi:hypothetical protein PHLGIDRAFT_17469 [Phlebiopsis gigantea 11061_1 CR5-6]|uniref:Uncharacterized protein n=1 Tax=Phlebiopsis gigantea (strain 11061_1 CR5-6) TaxID=745531 RepID=A0A0C3P8V2_PHLG1|nr:hypothetical protein PHLGIDRAFT_17469 [Phlebiopsis gigantea 11061_1 CR5-6]